MYIFLWVVFPRVHHVAPRGLYSSPEWTNQTNAIERTFLSVVVIVVEGEMRGVQLVAA